MRILWVKSDFLHPTTRGGQIRTLEMIRRLHARHEVHYIAYDNPAYPEGLRRASEYCSYAYPIEHNVPARGSLRFLAQVARSFASPMPVALSRYCSPQMSSKIRQLRSTGNFDAIVCDFLTPAPNFDDFSGCLLFQHNVETMIWRRHAETSHKLPARWYFDLQARRMFRYERRYCRDAAHVIAVSPVDAELMQETFGIERVSTVATGVDTEYFRAPVETTSNTSDLVFVGSMDWMPNSDGVTYFVESILPLIREKRPDCKVAVVGRNPGSEMQALARRDPRLIITGTVADVRPHLWGSTVSIVPLRVGGGTRLKIYESMAAGIPVVSTTIGAEGLAVSHNDNILLADTPRSFAHACVELLNNASERRRLASAALTLVVNRFSWDKITSEFETILFRHSATLTKV